MRIAQVAPLFESVPPRLPALAALPAGPAHHAARLPGHPRPRPALRGVIPSRADQDAEPGKILHEARDGEMAALREIPFGLYFGNVDSTPLFVVLAAAYWWSAMPTTSA